MFNLGRSGPPIDGDMAVKSFSNSSTDISSLPFVAAMDGPPSPEQIRSVTEQMKRGSIFRSARTSTTTSASPSIRSNTSSNDDMSTPSRKSSLRSNTSGILPAKERPDGVNILGKTIFSRNSRRPKLRGNSDGGRSLSSSLLLSGFGSGDQSAKEHYYDSAKQRRRGTLTMDAASGESSRDFISKPFNFQHLTHTRQDELPDLARTSGPQLASEFLVHRATQQPRSELKGIRADDLHFRNFPSVAAASEERPQGDVQRRRLHQSSPPRRPNLTTSRSYDNLRGVMPPPRPPRSPMTAEYAPDVPVRVSSRTASVLFETFDITPSDRPQTSAGFSRVLPTSHPTTPEWARESMSSEYQVDRWPLASMASQSSFCSAELEDVPEEDEVVAARRSRLMLDIRASQSVPNFHVADSSCAERFDLAKLASELPTPTTLHSPAEATHRRASNSWFDDDWEADIDYCYDHEAEANCNYEWTRASMDTARGFDLSQRSPERNQTLTVDSDAARTFRPSLLVPAPGDVPDMSPLSALSSESVLHTPALSAPPKRRFIPSHASSFKESHGFNLSPSLLIPHDFSAQIEQESMFDEFLTTSQDFHVVSSKDTLPMFQATPFPPASDDSQSSTASHRGSGRSSGFSNTASYEALSMSSRSTSVVPEEYTGGSTGSLPDLLNSREVSSHLVTAKNDVAEALTVDEVAHIIPELTSVSSFRKIGSMTDLAQTESREPCAANFSYHIPSHGRKISAPVTSLEQKLPQTGRQRSKSSAQLLGSPKRRERSSKGYVLFPQTQAQI